MILSVQLLSIVEHSVHLREFNMWMNGPRVHWARGLQLVFQLFIIFNKGEILHLDDKVFDQGNTQEASNEAHHLSMIITFITASHMAVEQLTLLRLANAKNSAAREFVELDIIKRFRQYGMIRFFL